MNTATPPAFPQWDDAATAGMDQPHLLLYRSNLLGSDLRITNYGGGNTSAKIWQRDPLSGADVEVLAPETLRSQVMEAIDTMRNRYGADPQRPDTDRDSARRGVKRTPRNTVAKR